MSCCALATEGAPEGLRDSSEVVGVFLVMEQAEAPLSLVQVAERNLLEEVDAALLRGDAMEQINERHHTPLLAAVLGGHVDMAQLLLERAANPNGCKRVSNGDTPLHVAARTGHVRLLQLLLWHGAELVRALSWLLRVHPARFPVVKVTFWW